VTGARVDLAGQLASDTCWQRAKKKTGALQGWTGKAATHTTAVAAGNVAGTGAAVVDCTSTAAETVVAVSTMRFVAAAAVVLTSRKGLQTIAAAAVVGGSNLWCRAAVGGAEKRSPGPRTAEAHEN
jgi:hypothetical protein